MKPEDCGMPSILNVSGGSCHVGSERWRAAAGYYM